MCKIWIFPPTAAGRLSSFCVQVRPRILPASPLTQRADPHGSPGENELNILAAKSAQSSLGARSEQLAAPAVFSNSRKT